MTYMQYTRSRRVAQLEHNISDDKNLWSGVVEGSKWIGVSAFHLSIAVTPLVMRTGKRRETGTGYSKPFVQPKRWPRDVSWSHLPNGTWGESETPQAHWNWDEHQRQETLLKNDIRMSSPNQTVHSEQLHELGVASALSDEGDSGNEDDGIQTNSDATVRLVTLPAGWNVVLNSLRQVVYCHVKSGIACFQMPENPELLDDLKFENGTGSGSGNVSQKRRTDCTRRLSNRPEHGKLKISRDNHPQRSSQYVENQVMVKSPSCWIDHFQMKPERRRTTKLTDTAEPMLRDVIELKQAALWRGGTIRIDQACEAAAEGMVRQPKALRISFRSEEVRALSSTREHTKSLQTSHLASCISSSSAVELPQMSGGTCREKSSTDASDSSTCGSNCASRPERASGSSRKVSRRKGNFPLASIPVADIPRCYSFYSPVMSDDSGRNSREETTGSEGDKKSTPLSESGTTGCGAERKIPQPETVAHSGTSNYRSRSGSVQTTYGSLGNEHFGLSASYRTESVSRECILGMDDVSFMWSPLESTDRPGRHAGKDGADNRSTSIDTSLSRMCSNDATTTDDRKNGDILRMQSVSPTHTCSAAQTAAE